MPRRRRLRRNPDVDLNTQEGFYRATQLARPRVANTRGIDSGEVVSEAYEILEITGGKPGVRSESDLIKALDQAVSQLLAKRREQEKVKAGLREATAEELYALGAPAGRSAGDEEREQDIRDIKDAFYEIGVSAEQWDLIENPPRTNREAAMQGHAPQDAAVITLALAGATWGVMNTDTAIQDALAAIELADTKEDSDL
jgi:hypothetical protein